MVYLYIISMDMQLLVFPLCKSNLCYSSMSVRDSGSYIYQCALDTGDSKCIKTFAKISDHIKNNSYRTIITHSIQSRLTNIVCNDIILDLCKICLSISQTVITTYFVLIPSNCRYDNTMDSSHRQTSINLSCSCLSISFYKHIMYTLIYI